MANNPFNVGTRSVAVDPNRDQFASVIQSTQVVTADTVDIPTNDIAPFSFIAYLPGGPVEVLSQWMGDALEPDLAIMTRDFEPNRAVLDRLENGTLIPDFSQPLNVDSNIMQRWYELFPELIGPIQFTNGTTYKTWHEYAQYKGWVPGGAFGEKRL